MKPYGKHAYTSRSKLVLSAYNSVRVRLLNSQALLEGTNLVLFTINETTLVNWYKHTERVNEIKTLLQGLELSTLSTSSRDPLPAPRQKTTIT